MECYPDAEGVVQMKPSYAAGRDATVFVNNDRSIMYPQILRTNDWQKTPNVVRLIYNSDEACIAAFAKNVSGSRASLASRGGREITYFEEVSDLSGTSRTNALKDLAEKELMEKSADIEYVRFEHAYVPMTIFDPVEIHYADLTWNGTADNITVDLSPSTKTQTRIKRILTEDIEISSGASVYRE